MNDKVLKSYSTPQFEIAVVEMPNGSYRVISAQLDQTQTSEPLNDYKVASDIFNQKLQLLEGN